MRKASRYRRRRDERRRGVAANAGRAIRPVFLVGLAWVVSIAVSPRADADERAVEGWALRIVAKELDRESGRLTVRVRNEHEHEAVTAWGVVIVEDPGSGRGTRQVQARELLPGNPLAPGAIDEIHTRIAVASLEDPTSRFAAVHVAPHFEILSDTSSRGDESMIEDCFADRAVWLREARSSLARLREARGASRDSAAPEAFWRAFWEGEVERLRAASRFVGIIDYEGAPTAETKRQRAIHAYAEIHQQIKWRIDDGTLELEEALDELEWLLEEGFIVPYTAGLRPGDLERLAAGPGGRR